MCTGFELSPESRSEYMIAVRFVSFHRIVSGRDVRDARTTQDGRGTLGYNCALTRVEAKQSNAVGRVENFIIRCMKDKFRV